MNPVKVSRERLNKLTDLPNIGKAGAGDLRELGISQAHQLIGRCPYEMHQTLCARTGVQHDPCVIDVFISITQFMNGDDPEPWWHYTDERKSYLSQQA